MTFRRPAPKPATQWTADSLPTPREPAPSLALRIPDGKARLCVSVPKNPPLRSRAYRMWVASKQCIHCGRPGPSQCAHADESKGGGMKSSDETCFPLCADSVGRQGCHSLIGASGKFTQAQRRRLEELYANATQLAAMLEGVYPEAFRVRLWQKGLA